MNFNDPCVDMKRSNISTPSPNELVAIEQDLQATINRLPGECVCSKPLKHSVFLILTGLVASVCVCYGETNSRINTPLFYKEKLDAISHLFKTNSPSVSNAIYFIQTTITNGILLATNHESTESEWKTVRLTETKLTLQCISNLQSALDKEWTPEDLPSENVGVLRGVPLPSGVSPHEIKDPSLRIQYESAIEANNSKARVFNDARQQRLEINQLLPKVCSYLGSIYSQKPEPQQQLEHLLAEYKIHPRTRSNILDNIRTREGSSP